MHKQTATRQTTTTTMMARRRQSRVKMKPPWPAETRSNSSISKSLLLLFIITLISCDISSSLSSSPLLNPTRSPRSPAEVHRPKTLSIDGDEHQSFASGEPEQPPAPGQPQFVTSDAKDLIVIASSWQSEVYLPCMIINLDEDQTVSWIRKRDSLVLTIDKLRLIDDSRLRLTQSSNDWTLILSQPSQLDAGLYECQVSSMEPKLSQLVELRIVAANSSISNFSSLFARPGERLNVTCTIEAPQRTDFVYWYKNKEPIQFDNLKARPVDVLHRYAGSPGRDEEPAGGHRDDQENEVERDQNDDDNHEQDDDDEQEKEDAAALREKQSNLKMMLDVNDKDQARLRRRRTEEARKVIKLSEKRRPQQKGANMAKTSNNNNKTAKQFQVFRSSSSLIIKESQLNDTANYTCLPSNAKPSHINIVVIENGLETQPEKRSLQADGASSSGGAHFILKLRLFCNLILVRSVNFISPGQLDKPTGTMKDTSIQDTFHALLGVPELAILVMSLATTIILIKQMNIPFE